MKRKERLLLAINVVTELADELITRNGEEIEHPADYFSKDEIHNIKVGIRDGKKAIETIWKNADLLKTLLGEEVKP